MKESTYVSAWEAKENEEDFMELAKKVKGFFEAANKLVKEYLEKRTKEGKRNLENGSKS